MLLRWQVGGRAERLGWFGMARSGGYLIAPTAAAWLLTWLDPATVFTIIGFTSCLAFLPVLMLKPSRDQFDSRQNRGPKLPTLRDQVQTAFFSVVSNRTLWLAGPLEMLVYVSIYSIRAFLPLYALYVAGFNLIMVGLFFSIQEGAHLLTRPLGGRLGDRVGYLRAIAVGFLLIAPALALLPLASSGQPLAADRDCARLRPGSDLSVDCRSRQRRNTSSASGYWHGFSGHHAQCR